MAARELITDDFAATEPSTGFRDASNLELAFDTREALDVHYEDVDTRAATSS